MKRLSLVEWLVVAGVGIAAFAWEGVARAQPDPESSAAAPHPAEHAADEHTVHHPEPFNFADIERFKRERRMAAGDEKDAHGTVPVPVTPYAYLLINAVALFWLYYRLGKKPVMAGLESRRAMVAKELDEAAKIKAEAQARLDEYTARLDDLDHELGRIKQDLLATGEADRDRMVREAEERATRMRKDAQFLLEQELRQLRNDLLRYTVDAATAAAEQVLKARVTPQDQERVADEYLKLIAALSPAPATTMIRSRSDPARAPGEGTS